MKSPAFKKRRQSRRHDEMRDFVDADGQCSIGDRAVGWRSLDKLGMTQRARPWQEVAERVGARCAPSLSLALLGALRFASCAHGGDAKLHLVHNDLGHALEHVGLPR